MRRRRSSTSPPLPFILVVLWLLPVSACFVLLTTTTTTTDIAPLVSSHCFSLRGRIGTGRARTTQIAVMSGTIGGDEDGGADVPPPIEIEVEQKFALPTTSDASAVERKLSKLGFARIGPRKRFTDWYFDLPAPRWALSTNDTWLRYREVKVGTASTWGWRGVWQLKRGQGGQGGGNGATVYEELQGQAALDAALSMLPEDGGGGDDGDDDCRVDARDQMYDGYDVPHTPAKCGLVPFARFETHRSGWTVVDPDSSNTAFVGLCVDLDGTDFSYMVGEVEAVVASRAQVENARERIQLLVSKLVGSGQVETPVGKLEKYMMMHRKEHYEALVKAGVIGTAS